MAFIIGIAGGSGSGKTTFAKKIITHVSDHISILHMDSYYLAKQPPHNVTNSGKPNYDHPDAFDWELLFSHLKELKENRSIESPIYDFKTSSRMPETKKLGPSKIILFEGIFTLFKEEIRNILDILCFLQVDSDIRFTRRLHRDVSERGRTLDSVISQYYETVRPMYQQFLDPQKQYAHFIVGEETDVASTIVAAKIKEILKE